jgi:hypothetical protein
MKSILKLVAPALLLLVFMTNCDVVSTNVAEPDSGSNKQQTSPVNNPNGQSVDVELQWNRIKGAQNYQIKISKSNTFDVNIVDETVSGTTYTAKSLTPNTTYYWKIYPIKNKNSGPWSDVKSFTTGGGESASVTLISPVNNADKVSSILRFTWNKLENTNEYVYQLSDNNSFNSLILEKNVTGTSYIPDVLVYQKKYFWRVKGAGDEYTWSDVWAFTTGTADNDEEIDLTVTLIAPAHNADKVSTNLEFTWHVVPGVNSYQYQLSDNSTFSSVLQTATVEDTTYSPNGLVHQKKYHWRVRVAGNDNVWSEVRTFTTGAQNDDNTELIVTLIAPAHNADKVSTNLEFTWQPISGVSAYQYQYSDNSTFSSVLHNATVEGSSYKPNGLVHQKKYHWRVRVSGNDNVWSEVRTFTTGIQNNDGDTQTPVTLLTPLNNASGVALVTDFTWQEKPGILEYKYQLSEKNTFSSVVDDKIVQGTLYSPNVLTYSKSECFRISMVRCLQF